MTTATTAGTGLLAAIASGLVIAWAAVLVLGDVVARRRSRPSPLQSLPASRQLGESIPADTIAGR